MLLWHGGITQESVSEIASARQTETDRFDRQTKPEETDRQRQTETDRQRQIKTDKDKKHQQKTNKQQTEKTS